MQTTLIVKADTVFCKGKKVRICRENKTGKEKSWSCPQSSRSIHRRFMVYFQVVPAEKNNQSHLPPQFRGWHQF